MENICSHKYIETTEKKNADGGYQSKTFHYKCHRNSECEICGHCASDCPGHEMQPGIENQGIRMNDSRIQKPFNANHVGNVRIA